MTSRSSDSRTKSPVVKETQSFPNLQLLGILLVKTSLRNLPSVERFKLAQHCLDYGIQVAGSQGSLSSMRSPRDEQVLHSLVAVKGNDEVITSWSTLAGLAVSINIGPDSIELLNSDRQLLCQHPRRKLGAVVAPPGPHHSLVYIGHDALSTYRLAVVVGMADREMAKEAARHYNNTELRTAPSVSGRKNSRNSHQSQRTNSSYTPSGDFSGPSSPVSPPRNRRSPVQSTFPSHSPANGFGEHMSEPALPPRRPVRSSVESTRGSYISTANFDNHDYENDPFYDSFGFNCGQQEKLYDPVVLVVDAPRKKKMSDRILFQHLDRFVNDERNYCDLLDDLIQIRSESVDGEFRYALKHLLEMKTFHAKVLLKLTSDENQLGIDLVSDTFTLLADDMRCYVDYLRGTQSVEKIAKVHLSNNTKAMSQLVQTRKRIITYHLNLESWIDATSSSLQYDKLLKTINKLKEICKEADTMMIIAGVRKTPYHLESYLPLIRHGNFSVEGKGFKKDQAYKLLLFRDILVFAISKDNYIECFEALRVEKLMVVDDKKSDREIRIRLTVDHGERRGTEVIQLNSVSDGTTLQWKEDLLKLLEDQVTRISQAYKATVVDNSIN